MLKCTTVVIESTHATDTTRNTQVSSALDSSQNIYSGYRIPIVSEYLAFLSDNAHKLTLQDMLILCTFGPYAEHLLWLVTSPVLVSICPLSDTVMTGINRPAQVSSALDSCNDSKVDLFPKFVLCSFPMLTGVRRPPQLSLWPPLHQSLRVLSRRIVSHSYPKWFLSLTHVCFSYGYLTT